MPETRILSDTRYEKLLKDLRTLIQEGKDRAQRAAAQELLQTYWEIGRRITEENLSGHAGYGDSIRVDLAEDLQIDEKTLLRAELFFERYKNGAPRGTNLTWSHYRELLPIEDAQARKFYESQAEKEDWTRDELVRAIRRDAFESGEWRSKFPRRNDVYNP